MEKSEIKEKVVKIIGEAGINTDEAGMAEKIALDNISSLTAMSVFIRLENAFGISFPDRYIKIDTLQNADALSELIISLKNDEK